MKETIWVLTYLASRNKKEIETKTVKTKTRTTLLKAKVDLAKSIKRKLGNDILFEIVDSKEDMVSYLSNIFGFKQ